MPVPRHRLVRFALRFAACSLLVVAVACVADGSAEAGRAAAETPAVEDGQGEEVEHGEEAAEVELARPMTELHRFTTKLGYSIAAENGPLAGFYLDEVDEVLAEVGEIESYEGMPIARTAAVIVDPLRADLRRELEAERWPEAEEAYRALVVGCNRCHAATGHEFLVILPAEGEPPFAQRFTAD